MPRIYIETYGCTANQSDTEIMKGLLNRSGFEIVRNETLADIVILNTCSVKQTTENRIRNRVKDLKEKFPENRIIIAGCMPESEYDLIKEISPKSNLISTHNVKEIPKIVQKTLQKKRVEYLGDSREDKLCLPKIRDNSLIAKVQIGKGCVSKCSFCSTKLAKGNLFSYPKNKILEEIKLSLNSGCKEIQLTSQDTGCYGFDKTSNLADLLNEVVKLSGKFRVRIGMLNPYNFLINDFLNELIEVYKNNKIYKFLHLPIQSGSDKILEKMNRNHRVEDFLKIVNKFRTEIEDLNLWTDFIVGFPGETEEDFQKSMDLLKKINPTHVNISRFGPRPGTKAKNMDQIDSKVKKERSKEMSKLVREISSKMNKSLKGRKFEVLITEKIKKGKYKGRNESYKSVLIKSENDIRGKFVQVEIEGTKKGYLFGKII